MKINAEIQFEWYIQSLSQTFGVTFPSFVSSVRVSRLFTGGREDMLAVTGRMSAFRHGCVVGVTVLVALTRRAVASRSLMLREHVDRLVKVLCQLSLQVGRGSLTYCLLSDLIVLLVHLGDLLVGGAHILDTEWIERGRRVLDLLLVELLDLALDRPDDRVASASQLDVLLNALRLDLLEELACTLDLIAPSLEILAVVESGLLISLVKHDQELLAPIFVHLEPIPVSFESADAHGLQSAHLLLNLLVFVSRLEYFFVAQLIAVLVVHWRSVGCGQLLSFTLLVSLQEQTLKLLQLISGHLRRRLLIELREVACCSDLGRHPHSGHATQMPLLRLSARSSDSRLTRHVFQLEVLGVILLGLDQGTQIKTELAVNGGRLGLEQVVVQRAGLHNASARFSRYPQPEGLAEDVRLEAPLVNVRLLRLDPVLHGEASLLSLRMRLAVEQTKMIALTLSRCRCLEHLTSTRREHHSLLVGAEHADHWVHIY